MNDLMVESDLQILEESSSNPVWVQVGTLLDGYSNKPHKMAHVVFNDHSILFIGSEDQFPGKDLLKPGQSTPDLVLEDYCVLPGLIEAHAHIFLEGSELDFDKRKAYLDLSPHQLFQLARERIRKLIPFGIMAYRDAGDKHGVGLAVSAEYQEKNNGVTPYIDSPGAAIHHQGRYGSFMGEPLEHFDSERACVENRIVKGAYRIKLIPTGIINFKKGQVTAPPQMTAEETKHLVAASKALDRQTFAHASGTEGIELVVEAGVDSVEHGFFISQDQLAKMRDRDIAWVPTFAPVQMQIDKAASIGWDHKVVDNLKRIIEGHGESLRQAHRLGVQVIAGSDAGSYGVPHAAGFLYELEQMEKAGMDSLSVINSATGISSNRLGYHEKIGCLKAGYKPRMIFTRYDILETVSNLSNEKVCFFDGQVYGSKNRDVSRL